MERFTDATLARWEELSRDLEELQGVLYFALRPEQRRLRGELIAALQTQAARELLIVRWVRNVSFRYTFDPLAATGSLRSFGGRFNPGVDLDADTLSPFPALYIAEDAETAYREKFQLPSTDLVDGLNPAELALASKTSFSTIALNGRLCHLFDLTTPQSLEPIAKVFKKIQMPARARQLQRRLAIAPRAMSMIRSGKQLYDAALTHNWRTLPAQFGLPAPSHTLAELIRAAAFEGIVFQSTKGGGRCIAIFPDCLRGESYLELADEAPSTVRATRLDQNNGVELGGMHTLSHFSQSE